MRDRQHHTPRLDDSEPDRKPDIDKASVRSASFLEAEAYFEAQRERYWRCVQESD